MTDDSLQKRLEQSRLYENIFKKMMFYPEIERLRFAGATDEMITEAFSEVTNPLGQYRIGRIILGGPEYVKRNYNICIEYLTNPNRPTLDSVGQKYRIRGERVRQIMERFKTNLCICDAKEREKYGKIDENINEQQNRYLSRLKKGLYGRIMDKILEQNQPNDKIEELK